MAFQPDALKWLLSNAPLTEHSSSTKRHKRLAREAQPDAVAVLTTSLNPDSGQSAIDYLRAVLESGAHAITATARSHGYRELTDLAREGQAFSF